jgi:dipeptidyl aminopeptidase/acylaminoacyl peptidase
MKNIQLCHSRNRSVMLSGHPKRKAFYYMKPLLILFSILCLLFCVVCTISIYTAWTLVHPERKALNVPSDASIVFQDVAFKDIENEINLKGWFFPSTSKNKVAIVSHGYADHRMSFDEESFDFYQNFVDQGYNVLAFDFRNSGTSDGAVTSVGDFEQSDLLGAIDFVKTKSMDEIVLVGVSMGAAISLVVAEEEKELVKGIIADSPFSDLEDYLKENLPLWSDLPHFPFTWITLESSKLIYGIDFRKVSPYRSVQNIQDIPILLIHNVNDDSIPFKNAEKIYDSSPKNIKLVKFDTKGHADNFKNEPSKYLKEVNQFLDRLSSSNN